MRRTVAVAVAVLTLAGAGCSSGSGPTEAEKQYAAAKPEKPRTGSDFERTCADGLGFPGLTAYEKKAGRVHPMAVVKKTDDSWYVDSPSGSDFPATWMVDTVAGTDKTELVVCVEQTATKPTSRICDMEDRETKEKYKMTMYDVDYRIRVLDAQSGKSVFEKKGTKSEKDCPVVTFRRSGEDKSKYYPSIDNKTIRPVVKPYVAP
ncbi:hypothetical protein AB0M36_05955 [Actinoplanes sp. NPDC051346]|uniref:hypothetical protein n=1 Tax=Actinoplanes sp. NPDC051346 TaxID=3155048 RepID=UPI00344A8544